MGLGKLLKNDCRHVPLRLRVREVPARGEGPHRQPVVPPQPAGGPGEVPELRLRAQQGHRLALRRPNQPGKSAFARGDLAKRGARFSFQSLWSGMYLRWLVDPAPQCLAAKKAEEIITRNKQAKAKVLGVKFLEVLVSTSKFLRSTSKFLRRTSKFKIPIEFF